MLCLIACVLSLCGGGYLGYRYGSYVRDKGAKVIGAAKS